MFPWTHDATMWPHARKSSSDRRVTVPLNPQRDGDSSLAPEVCTYGCQSTKAANPNLRGLRAGCFCEHLRPDGLRRSRGRDAGAGEQPALGSGWHWGAAAHADEAPLAGLPLASCCEARFLTVHRRHRSAPGGGDPCTKGLGVCPSDRGPQAWCF